MAIADQLDRLNVLRQNLASALTGKGVTADGTEGLETLVPKVSEIAGTAQVQRYAGTFTTDNNGEATVDCGFKPDVVFMLNDKAPVSNSRVDSMSMVFNEGFDSSKNNFTMIATSVGPLAASWTAWTSTGFTVSMLQYDFNWNKSNLSNQTISYVAIKYT